MAVPTLVRERTPQLIVLAVILALNAIISPGFFSIGIQNGRFYGSLIDVLNRGAPVTLLAIGMTLILILKHIDLSVGYVAGFSGAVAAILLTKYSLNVWLSILLVLLLGLAIGFYQGTLVTRVKVPAFVTTLAGMFIFRGLLNLTLQETGTIIIPDATFNALSNG